MSVKHPRKVNIIGHLHPDTDSICSAIALANLKNTIGPAVYEPRRAGSINRETAFVLRHFNVDAPRLITSVRPQIKDIDYQPVQGINENMSLFSAWIKMREENQDTLCICTPEKKLQGIIALKDIANANLEIFDKSMLSQAHTPLANVAEVLSAEQIAGDPDRIISKGKILVGTSLELLDETIKPNDILLVTNNEEVQRFSLMRGASVLIICCDAKPSKEICELAQEKGADILLTPYDTYAATKLVSMSIPVRAIMLTKHIITFTLNTQVEEVRKTMAETRHRFFPILDEDGLLAGVISSATLFDINRKHVILVDHNEISQAVDGLSHAIILEIIDHHRLGNIETTTPVAFRNQPVGCTCTIVKQMYDEHNIEPTPQMAGIMLSAILSDTLAFRSPTCTEADKIAAEALAGVAGVNLETYADQMFEAGADIAGRTAEDVFKSDFKVFSRGSVHFGVGQLSFMTEKTRHAAEDLLGPYLSRAAAEHNLPHIFFLFTDVKTSSSDILFAGHGAGAIVEDAFGVTTHDNMAVLPGIVSRKKQVIPQMMQAFERLQEE